MFCPVCTQTTLMMTERQGIEIDYCPRCRGVWLDRGELDKLISLSAPRNEFDSRREDQPRASRPTFEQGRSRSEFEAAPEYRPEVERPYLGERPYPSERDRYEQRHPEYRKPKKRESWLGELFDWD